MRSRSPILALEGPPARTGSGPDHRPPRFIGAYCGIRRRFSTLGVRGAPAGFTQLYPSFSSVSLARTFILNDLFVVAAQRRAGVGSLLLRAATEHARSLRAVRVTLNTDIANVTAQSVYEARGWKRDREYFVYHFLPQG